MNLNFTYTALILLLPVILIFFGCREQQNRQSEPETFTRDASGLYSLAMLHYRASDTRQALILMDSALVVSKKTGDYQTSANALNMMGSYYLDMGDTAKAVNLIEKSLRIAKERRHYRQVGVALTNLALVETGKPGYSDRLREAIGYFRKAGNYCPELGMVYNNLGNHASNPDMALFYLNKAVEAGDLNNDHEVTVMA